MPEPMKNIEALQWIDEPVNTSIKPELEDFALHQQRTITNTVLKKARENVFVPLGLVATTACLTLGLINLKSGNSKRQQLFMRGRVGFQAFTLAAMTIGMVLHQSTREGRNKKSG